MFMFSEVHIQTNQVANANELANCVENLFQNPKHLKLRQQKAKVWMHAHVHPCCTVTLDAKHLFMHRQQFYLESKLCRACAVVL